MLNKYINYIEYIRRKKQSFYSEFVTKNFIAHSDTSGSLTRQY